MRVAVVSDVHGNIDALEVVLAEIARRRCDRVVVAGDIVGYGAFPNECVSAIAALDPVVVAGNHDLIAIGQLDDSRCGPTAKTTLSWTAEVLTAASREYLSGLPLHATLPEGVVVTHGSLGNPQQYVRDNPKAREQLHGLAAHSDAWLLVLGHTHLPWLLAERRGTLVGPSGGAAVLGPGERHLLNPGSVGQSRSRSRRLRALMAVVEVAADRRTVEMLALPYDVERARAGLRAAGLPDCSYHLAPPSRARVLALRARAHLRRTRSALRPRSPAPVRANADQLAPDEARPKIAS